MSTEAMLIVLDWSGGNQREIDRLKEQKAAPPPQKSLRVAENNSEPKETTGKSDTWLTCVLCPLEVTPLYGSRDIAGLNRRYGRPPWNDISNSE